MRILIFDMDGTLINSGNSITNTINHVRNNLGLKKLEKDYILEKVNDPKIDTAQFFYGTLKLTKKQKMLFEEHYNATCLDNIRLYDGVAKLIENLKSDFSLAIATNANSNFARKMLNHLEIGKYFKTILGYNNVQRPKPHPEIINKILNKHNVQKQNAQLIGDSHKDILAAKNAGVDWILVNWGFSNHSNNAIETICQLEKKIFDKFNLQNGSVKYFVSSKF